MTSTYDIAVVGGGLIGLMAAHELSRAFPDRSIALVAPAFQPDDGRTTAMLMPAVERLRTHGLWANLEESAAPLRVMRIIDGSERLVRAPVTTFDAAEIEQDAFGYNVPNALAGLTLEQALADMQNVARVEATVHEVLLNDNDVELVLSDKTRMRAAHIAAADGRNSLLRKAAGIAVLEWSYPQTALVTTFQHTLPHNDVSTEFHTATGPFTQVPLPPTAEARHRSSLVWVETPEEAKRLQAQPVEVLSRIAERKMQSMLGKVEFEEEPQAFPLSGMMARSFAAGRVAILGEAAHVFPPIGAQGFNLGVRDILSLTQNLADGSQTPLQDYDTSRRGDVLVRTAGVDALNRSVLTDLLPVQAGRALGMSALANVGVLRRAVMRRGLGA